MSGRDTAPTVPRCPKCNAAQPPAQGLANARCASCGGLLRSFEAGAAQLGQTPAAAAPPARPFTLGDDRHPSLQKVLSALLVGTAALGLTGLMLRGALPASAEIDPTLLQEPVQTPDTEADNFTFRYMGEVYEVDPVARYELWGLVVAHNDIGSIWDSYHDDKSVDTKDLCVIWGDNVRTDDFHRVEFESGSWTCYYRYPNGVSFSHQHLSNNHLITDSEAIRSQIDGVRVGDQVHIKGMLVNYTNPGQWQGWWRKTSLTRNDAGNTACEVFFVDQLDVVQQGTPIWYALTSLAWWVFALAALAKVGLFVHGVLRS